MKQLNMMSLFMITLFSSLAFARGGGGGGGGSFPNTSCAKKIVARVQLSCKLDAFSDNSDTSKISAQLSECTQGPPIYANKAYEGTIESGYCKGPTLERFLIKPSAYANGFNTLLPAVGRMQNLFTGAPLGSSVSLTAIYYYSVSCDKMQALAETTEVNNKSSILTNFGCSNMNEVGFAGIFP